MIRKLQSERNLKPDPAVWIIDEQHEPNDNQKKHNVMDFIWLAAICFLFWYFSPH